MKMKNNVEIIMCCVRLHNYVINEDFDMSIDPITLGKEIHGIEPMSVMGIDNVSRDSSLGYLPTTPDDFCFDIAGVSETRNRIVDYIREKKIRRPEYNKIRNNN